jgi:hypothetical protein
MAGAIPSARAGALKLLRIAIDTKNNSALLETALFPFDSPITMHHLRLTQTHPSAENATHLMAPPCGVLGALLILAGNMS